MIPIIGVMMGAYIFTRMLALVMNPQAHIVLKVFAVGTMLLSGLGVALLFATGSPPTVAN